MISANGGGNQGRTTTMTNYTGHRYEREITEAFDIVAGLDAIVGLIDSITERDFDMFLKGVYAALGVESEGIEDLSEQTFVVAWRVAQGIPA